MASTAQKAAVKRAFGEVTGKGNKPSPMASLREYARTHPPKRDVQDQSKRQSLGGMMGGNNGPRGTGGTGPIGRNTPPRRASGGTKR